MKSFLVTPSQTDPVPIAVGDDRRRAQRSTEPAGAFQIRHQSARRGVGDEPVGAHLLRENHLACLATFDPGQYAEGARGEIAGITCRHVIVDAIQEGTSVGDIFRENLVCFFHNILPENRRRSNRHILDLHLLRNIWYLLDAVDIYGRDSRVDGFGHLIRWVSLVHYLNRPHLLFERFVANMLAMPNPVQ
jgi:hypothetical protein